MHIRIEKKGKKALSIISEKTLPKHPANPRLLNLLLTIKSILFIIYKIISFQSAKVMGSKIMRNTMFVVFCGPARR
jgi:capsule polysaccharide export protein KpsE/RkpR